MPDLDGKVAVVTGGNRDIGRAIALAMARADASVAIAARNEDSLSGLATELQTVGSPCLAVRCDVADPASVDALGDAVLKRFGQTDVVVANAGVAGPTKPLHEITPLEWRECMATDLDGVYLTFRRFRARDDRAPERKPHRDPFYDGQAPTQGPDPYAAAKMGLIGLVRTLAVELGPIGSAPTASARAQSETPRMVSVIRAQAQAPGSSTRKPVGGSLIVPRSSGWLRRTRSRQLVSFLLRTPPRQLQEKISTSPPAWLCTEE